MKTTNKITKTPFGAVLPLLVIFGLTNAAMAQTTARIAFNASVTVQTSVKPPRSATYSQIFSMNPNGGGVAQLTSASANALAPRWSPGQQYIAFWRNNILWVMEAKGEANGGRTFAVATAGLAGSDWSPDGSMLVFRGARTNLYIVSVNADTGTVGPPVLFRTGSYYDPSWSPDGTRIAFSGSDDGNTEVIKVRDVATGAEISFGAAPTDNITPQWSPEGSLIAFSGPITTTTTSRNGKQITSTANEIFIADADGGNITRVTALSSFTAFPAWSPDATSLAFRSDVSGTSAIYSMLLSSNTAALLRSPGNNPDWNP